MSNPRIHQSHPESTHVEDGYVYLVLEMAFTRVLCVSVVSCEIVGVGRCLVWVGGRLCGGLVGVLIWGIYG